METVFLIAICRQCGDKWQSKTVSNDLRSTFLDSIGVFDCHLPGVSINPFHSDGFSVYIDTLSMNFSILYFKGLQVKISKF